MKQGIDHDFQALADTSSTNSDLLINKLHTIRSKLDVEKQDLKRERNTFDRTCEDLDKQISELKYHKKELQSKFKIKEAKYIGKRRRFKALEGQYLHTLELQQTTLLKLNDLK